MRFLMNLTWYIHESLQFFFSKTKKLKSFGIYPKKNHNCYQILVDKFMFCIKEWCSVNILFLTIFVKV